MPQYHLNQINFKKPLKLALVVIVVLSFEVGGYPRNQRKPTMPIEVATTINGLVATNPVSTDALASADDHIRLLKATILNTFPNITGPITLTHTEINSLDTRLQALEDAFTSGTKMLFQQSTAPTGWTKVTAHNDKALRVVSGTAGSGGTNPFSTLDATAVGTINSSISGSTAGHTLSVAEIPAHSHNSNGQADRVQEGYDNGTSYAGYSPSAGNHSPTTWSTSSTGGGGSHSHGAGTLAVTSVFTGSANALDVQYVDVIIATKN
jgi:hypothetical protein